MKYIKRYILLILLVICFSCSHASLIDKSDMMKIMSELFIADQWVEDNRFLVASDTTAIYEPIIRDNGYTLEDFRFSMDIYLNDPDYFIEILKGAKKYLSDKLEEVDKLIEINQRKQMARSYARRNPFGEVLLVPNISFQELDRRVQNCLPFFDYSFFNSYPIYQGPMRKSRIYDTKRNHILYDFDKGLYR